VKKVFAFMAVLMMIVALLPSVAWAQQLPCRFHGWVLLDGAAVPDGTVVTATILGYEFTDDTPSPYGASTYLVTVTPPVGVNFPDGTTVTFKVGDYPAAQTGSFEKGGNLELNLDAWVAATPTPAPTPTPTTTPTPTAVPTQTPTPTPTPVPTPTPTPPGVPTSEPVDISSYLGSDGRVEQGIPTLLTIDEVVALEIALGTRALTVDMTPLETIQMQRMLQNVPEPPDGYVIVGSAYDLKPDGATFNPPITINMSYDPNEVPEDVDKDDLIIASFDVMAGETGEWEMLDSSPHSSKANVVTAEAQHFTVFAVLADTSVTPLNSWVVIGPILWLALIGLITLGLLRFY
jgi:hypothetical protein